MDERKNSPPKKPSRSPAREPKPLLFVHINHPRDAASEETRKAVRSYVASDSGSSSRTDSAAKQRERRKRKARTATLELETSDLVQSDSTSSSLLNTPSYGSTTPSPGLGAGRVDPFRSFPVPWHSCIPSLVDHYLVHIAPELHGDTLPGSRGALRNSWWPEIMNDAGLFYATLLVSASHQWTTTPTQPNSVLLQWLRGNAITSINESMADPQRRLSDVTIGAVLTLGSWEFHHGDPMAYQMHMSGLQTMIRMRGGLEQADFANVLVCLILSVGHDLALFAGVDPYFDSPHSGISESPKLEYTPKSPLPPGFARLDKIDLLVTNLLTHVRYLADLADPTTVLSPVAVSQTIEYLRNFEKVNILVTFCPFESDRDDRVLIHVHKYITLAALCFLRLLVLHRGMQADAFPGIEIEELLNAAIQIDPSLLVRSIYAEVIYWALFTMQCVFDVTQVRHLDTLISLTRQLGISDWPHTRAILKSFLFDDHMMDHCCQHTWNRLVQRAESKPLDDLQDLSLSPSSPAPLQSPGVEKTTRYDRSVAAVAFPDLEPFTFSSP